MAENWYNDGLKFSCTRCSRCCRHDSGYVFLSRNDVQRLTTHLKVTRSEFLRKYTIQVDFSLAQRISLAEQENFDCIFWKEGGCTVYPARPLQCRAYPFWPHNLARPEDWQELTKECPGINLGKHHNSEDIDRWIHKRESEPFVSS